VSLHHLIFRVIFSYFFGNFRRDIGGTSLHGGGIDAQDRVGRGNFGAEIQMRVNVRGSGNIAVAQPFLDFPEAHAVGIQEAGTAMPKLVEAENEDYGIITTKYMLQCYGKKLP